MRLGVNTYDNVCISIEADSIKKDWENKVEFDIVRPIGFRFNTDVHKYFFIDLDIVLVLYSIAIALMYLSH